ncbi:MULTISPECIES: ATP phosphoribosyltransferase regulatory subunit [unclassified Campylobacter]|uniref:ATP phosphoribosyltransferase regulatory subunit n=1 Tax=unclassified Campylobacter TaxID=2593542 RepID=UPI003D3294D5
MKDKSMTEVYEHEIPVGSRLYFGKSAATKRSIEQLASDLLNSEGFSEILTPFFSYHQHLSVNPTMLLRFSDHANHEISLRADSTVDVVRIVRARLKDELHKKWFYIQPIFKYPSSEFYQIGAELIGESELRTSVSLVSNILNKLKFDAVLQLSNIEIPHTICKILGLEIEIFENGQIERILSQNIPWLESLALLSNKKELEDVISVVPDALKTPLKNLLTLVCSVSHENIRIVPLYYSKMRYYDKLFFRFLSQNSIIAGGGNYEIDGVASSGFAIYTDALVDKIMER